MGTFLVIMLWFSLYCLGVCFLGYYFCTKSYGGVGPQLKYMIPIIGIMWLVKDNMKEKAKWE